MEVSNELSPILNSVVLIPVSLVFVWLYRTYVAKKARK